jgi:hypothetical protein
MISLKSIWEECEGKRHITKIDTIAWRCVEDQGKSFTRKIVKTDEEHQILEEMLEETKPAIQSDFKNLHYLLFTPFRYPPLNHGSRFGTLYERNLFYAALELKTALSEKAYYRLAWMKSYPSTDRKLHYTSFQCKVITEQGIDLCVDPFGQHKKSISSARSYTISQALGTSMRHEAIEAFVYFSARAPFPAKNIGVFCPNALINNKKGEIEKSFKAWDCYATQEVVEFSQKFSSPAIKEIFHIKDFFVNEQFPDIIQ